MSQAQTLCDVLRDMSLESWQDESVGDACEAPFMWAALFTFKPDTFEGVEVSDFDVTTLAGAILWCDSQGFYTVEGYRDPEVLRKRWEAEQRDLGGEETE